MISFNKKEKKKNEIQSSNLSYELLDPIATAVVSQDRHTTAKD